MQITNRDAGWTISSARRRSTGPGRVTPTSPGAMKWLTTDCRETLERASARETAARTAAGALARCLLARVRHRGASASCAAMLDAVTDVAIDAASTGRRAAVRATRRRCTAPTRRSASAWSAHIRQAKIDKDTVGGLVEVHVFGCPIGLGSCVHFDEKLDGRLAGAVMSIQAFKAVEIGLGKDCAMRPGSQVHDPIGFDAALRDAPSLGFTRPTNNAGGLEGGMTNGMPIVVRGTMKPISTLLRGLPSVDLNTHESEHSAYERSDVCALSAASVVMENVVAFDVAGAFLEKFGGDSMIQVRASYDAYLDLARRLPLEPLAGGAAMEVDQTEA